MLVCDYPSTCTLLLFSFKMSFIWDKLYLIPALKCWMLFFNVSFKKRFWICHISSHKHIIFARKIFVKRGGGGDYWNLTEFDVAVKLSLRRMTTWWRRQLFSYFYSSFSCYRYFMKQFVTKETFWYCKIEFKIKKLKVRIWIQFAWMYWMGITSTTWHHKKCYRHVQAECTDWLYIIPIKTYRYMLQNRKALKTFLNIIFWWNIYNKKINPNYY